VKNVAHRQTAIWGGKVWHLRQEAAGHPAGSIVTCEEVWWYGKPKKLECVLTVNGDRHVVRVPPEELFGTEVQADSAQQAPAEEDDYAPRAPVFRKGNKGDPFYVSLESYRLIEAETGMTPAQVDGAMLAALPSSEWLALLQIMRFVNKGVGKLPSVGPEKRPTAEVLALLEKNVIVWTGNWGADPKVELLPYSEGGSRETWTIDDTLRHRKSRSNWDP